jgi:hypothetical protein
VRVDLVAGLPGSGKTTLLRSLASEGAVVVDDIRSLAELPRAPVPWLAVADVNFCVPGIRGAAEAEIRARYPDAEVAWTFFENDPGACLENAARRDDGRPVRADIAALSRRYVLPVGVEPLPVHRTP